MDITDNFRKCINLKRENDKKLGINRPIFAKRKGSENMKKYKNLLAEISSLKEFLLEHRKAYLNLSPDFVKSEMSQMSEAERDRIDSEAQHILKTCSQLIQSYKHDLYNIENQNQEVENNLAIVEVIEAYLRSVCKIYTEQKAIRVKWTLEVEKLAKLEEKVSRNSNNWILNEDVNEIQQTPYAFEDDDFTEEEMQMFEMENQQLYSDLNSLTDEVKAIQSKVIKIAELQEVFTDKVLEQNEEIERISSTLVGTTENVKDANTQIRQAIQNNASFRVYVLFFILVMSFSLLFLDWYND